MTRCEGSRVPFSELLIPSESESKELSFDISFKTVHNAIVKLWPRKVRLYKRRHFENMELKAFTSL